MIHHKHSNEGAGFAALTDAERRRSVASTTAHIGQSARRAPALPGDPGDVELPLGFRMGSDGEILPDLPDLTLVVCMHLALSQTGGEGGLEALVDRLAPGDERLDHFHVQWILTDFAYVEGRVNAVFPGPVVIARWVTLPISVPEDIFWGTQAILQVLREKRELDAVSQEAAGAGKLQVLRPQFARALARGGEQVRAAVMGAHP